MFFNIIMFSILFGMSITLIWLGDTEGLPFTANVCRMLRVIGVFLFLAAFQYVLNINSCSGFIIN